MAIKRAESESQRAAAATTVMARITGSDGTVQAAESTFEGFALREAAAENSVDMIMQQLDRSPASIEEVNSTHCAFS